MQDEIKKYIDNIIRQELERLKEDKDPFLKTGRMGLSLFLFRMSDFTGVHHYRTLAHNLLDSISSSIPTKCPLEIYNGITGIGLAIMFCRDKGYITDDMDDLLKEIDNYVYKYSIKGLELYSNKYIGTFLDILVYVSYRTAHTADKELRSLFNRLWLAIFNKVSLNISSDFFLEPNPSDLKYNLAQYIYICSLGVSYGNAYKDRIIKVLSDLEHFIISNIPHLQSNKFVLAIALHYLIKAIGVKNCWQGHKETLIKDISIDYILEKELLPNDIFMTHGAPCLYMLLDLHNHKFTHRQLNIIINKIIRSDFFNYTYPLMHNTGFVGLDGILGSIITLFHIRYFQNE